MPLKKIIINATSTGNNKTTIKRHKNTINIFTEKSKVRKPFPILRVVAPQE